VFDQLKNIHREYGLLHRDVDLASPVGFTDDMIFVVLCEFGRNKIKSDRNYGDEHYRQNEFFVEK
jgi:hypothetical protein